VLGLGAIELIIALSRLRLQVPPGVPAGDPGGRIHGTLAQVAAALPSDATVVSRYDAGAVWPACPDKARNAGWQDPPEAPLKAPDVLVLAIRFRTAADVRAVVANADAALTALGWAPVPDLQDVVWSKRARDASVGGLARLSRAGSDGAGQSWTLTASATVPGPHRMAAC
jgi:hypothetical protein